MEYDREDIIIWQDDERLEDGCSYFVGWSADNIMKCVENGSALRMKLIAHDCCLGGFKMEDSQGGRVVMPVLMRCGVDPKRKRHEEPCRAWGISDVLYG